MDMITQILDGIFHPDKLNELATYLGPWLYVVMFAIIFAETGLVVTPFLPGDSLLFGLGAIAAAEGSSINLPLLAGLLVVAAILGDSVNYMIGRWIGPKAFASEKSLLLNKKHLTRAHEFYAKHGGKTIILARFVPIIRTFAPFVAGVGEMNFLRFAAYNIVGGVVWILLFLMGGYAFGQLPWVKTNHKLVFGGIILVSVLPLVWEVIQARLASKRGDSALLQATTLGEDITES